MFGKIRRTRQQRALADAKAEVDSLKRIIKVLETENENLALVVARDRERIKAETIIYGRKIAELEVDSGRPG